MTLDNFMNRIWLRFIKFIHYMTLHFLVENWLYRFRYGKDGLNLCPPSKVSRHLRVIFSNNIFISPII